MSSLIKRVYEKFSALDGRQRHNEKGYEVPDPTPMAPPVGYRAQPSLRDQIREMVRSEKLALEAEAAGFETFDEADDFDVGDDFDPTSPYEEVFDPTPAKELRKRKEKAEADEAKKKEDDEAKKKLEPSPPPPPPKPKEPSSDAD